MFTAADRESASAKILEYSKSDDRVVAAAVVGSLAFEDGDRWSDIDLTFGVRDSTPVAAVLADWTRWLHDQLDGLMLFDLPSGDTIYRVFLLPDGLQVDLSFTPASRFAAGGPRFRLMFGEVSERPPSPAPDAANLFGWGVAYARDARAMIDRGRPWMAAHCVAAVRDHALMIACIARGLPVRFGRGYDDLPAEVLDAFSPSFVSSLDREALLAAGKVAVEGLLREAQPVVEVAAAAAPRVRAWLDVSD